MHKKKIRGNRYEIFNQKQLDLLKSIGFDYKAEQELSDDDFVRLEKKLGDVLIIKGLDEKYNLA